MFPDVVVRVEDDPRVIVVASRLFDPAVRVLDSANVIEDRELAEVPTLPARVLLSEKAAVPTPSVAPWMVPVTEPVPTVRVAPEAISTVVALRV
jgi:hypothetical protein